MYVYNLETTGEVIFRYPRFIRLRLILDVVLFCFFKCFVTSSSIALSFIHSHAVEGKHV